MTSAEQCVRTGRHGQLIAEPRAGLPAEGKATGPVGVGQPASAAGVRGEDGRQTLAEYRSITRGSSTAELADGDAPALPGQVGDGVASGL